MADITSSQYLDAQPQILTPFFAMALRGETIA